MPELIVTLKGREIRRRPITAAETTIGRDAVCDLQIDNVGISRHHATVVVAEGSAWVRDERSANGVFVNAKQVERQALDDGDEIQIGKFLIRYVELGGPPLGEIAVAPSRRRVQPGGHDPKDTMALSQEDVARMVADRPTGAVAPPPAKAATGERAAPNLSAAFAERMAPPSESLGVRLPVAQPQTPPALLAAVVVLAVLVVALAAVVGVLLLQR